MNRFETLLNDLNKIVGLLEVSEKTVFEMIKKNDRFSIGISISELYNNQYDEYRNHLCCSGLLLGFSFFESYAYDLLELILKYKPELNNFKFKLKYVIDNQANLYDRVIEDYLRTVGFTEVIKCIASEFNFFEENENAELMLIYNIRNCIMHNGGLADDRISPKYRNGERIVLTSSDVNGFGIQGRKIASKMWDGYNKWKGQF